MLSLHALLEETYTRNSSKIEMTRICWSRNAFGLKAWTWRVMFSSMHKCFFSPSDYIFSPRLLLSDCGGEFLSYISVLRVFVVVFFATFTSFKTFDSGFIFFREGVQGYSQEIRKLVFLIAVLIFNCCILMHQWPLYLCSL